MSSYKEEKLLLEYRLEAAPVSVNHAYSYNPRLKRRFLSPEHKAQRNLIQLELLKLNNGFSHYRDRKLGVVIEWHAPTFFNKDGSIKRKDLSGIVKQLEDAILPAVGLDDSQVFLATQAKIPDTTEFVIFRIFLLHEDN